MNQDAVSENRPKLSNVLVAASLRADQWRHLNASARAWASASADTASKQRERCQERLADVLRLEHCWAYPGERLLSALRSALNDGDASTFARLAQKVSAAILSGDYRRDEHAWEADDDVDRTVLDALPPDILGVQDKPYFEVLIVTPADPGQWQRSKEEMRRMRRPEDPFHYTVVHVASYEDAALAMMVNSDLQSVVLVDGFGFASRHDIPDL